MHWPNSSSGMQSGTCHNTLSHTHRHTQATIAVYYRLPNNTKWRQVIILFSPNTFSQSIHMSLNATIVILCIVYYKTNPFIFYFSTSTVVGHWKIVDRVSSSQNPIKIFLEMPTITTTDCVPLNNLSIFSGTHLANCQAVFWFRFPQ